MHSSVTDQPFHLRSDTDPHFKSLLAPPHGTVRPALASRAARHRSLGRHGRTEVAPHTARLTPRTDPGQGHAPTEVIIDK